MSQDQEWIVRLQFLEEAQEYIDEIESNLMGLGDGISTAQLDAALRASHSIKGGSAMMGFEALSHVGHRLEDFLKVLRAGSKADQIDGQLEQLFLTTCDRLRQMAKCYHQRQPIDTPWLDQQIRPLIDQIYDRLGDPVAEDNVAVLSEEAGEDMRVMMFESEVGPCLDRLEGTLTDPDLPLLRQEFCIAAQELGGLSEMLDLEAFGQLCAQVNDVMGQAAPEHVEVIAQAALQVLQRSQALVLIGQFDAMPRQFELPPSVTAATTESVVSTAVGEAIAAVENEELHRAIEEFQRVDLSTTDDPLELIGGAPKLDAALAEADAFLEEEVESSSQEISSFLKDEQPQTPADPVEATGVADSIPQLGDIEALWQSGTFEGLADSEMATFVDILPDPQQQAPSEVSVPVEFNHPNPQATQETESSDIQTQSPPIQATPPQTQQADVTLRVSAQQIERLSELFGELNTERNGLGIQLKSMRSLVSLLGQRVRSLEQANLQLRQSYDQVATQIPTPQPALAHSAPISDLHQRFDVLEMDQYSDFHLLSQELIESVVQIQEVAADLEIALSSTESASREINRTSRQMQVNITQVRMRPLSEVTSRFHRILRELCLTHDKNVALKLHGGDTLVERRILEALQDPLMHLLRNSFDHGIEASGDRRNQGKPPQGTIQIRAGYRGNQVIITLQDDGAGINLDKIRTKVRQMGLSDAEIAASGEQELLNMIFEPGFSTAEQVTNLSGRGVGMDVVRTNLESIGGSIQVSTQAGQGTTFTITVPLSLSVTRVLVVESQGMLMAFPASVVEEMQLLSGMKIHQAANQEMVEWQGYTLPLVRLSDWMQFARPPIKAETEATPIINQDAALVVAQGEVPYALQCDRYWGEQEVTTHTVDGNILLPRGFSGCVVLGDGRVVPLVDVESLLNWILTGNRHEIAAPSTPASNPSEQSTVLIVDDSINVRRFLAITLEKAGYRVEQAKDGQDAIDKLQEGVLAQAIICDIEMPRLDGYGFLAKVKSLPEHAQIPVMMLTSRSGPKHRKLAMNLGAADYFSKPFKKQTLLARLNEVS